MTTSMSTWFRRGSPVLLILLLVALALLSRSFIAEAQRNMRLRTELNSLNKQIAELNGGNRLLADDLAALQRPLAIEKEARLKYGLRRAEEHVLIIPGATDASGSDDSSGGSGAQAGMWQHAALWWKYFAGQEGR